MMGEKMSENIVMVEWWENWSDEKKSGTTLMQEKVSKNHWGVRRGENEGRGRMSEEREDNERDKWARWWERVSDWWAKIKERERVSGWWARRWARIGESESDRNRTLSYILFQLPIIYYRFTLHAAPTITEHAAATTCANSTAVNFGWDVQNHTN